MDATSEARTRRCRVYHKAASGTVFLFYLDGDGGSRAGGARVHCRDSEGGRDMGIMMPGPPPNWALAST